MNIIVDIGHANGTGARGNGCEEHALCTVIAGHLRTALETDGHTVTVIDFPARSNTEDLRLTAKTANAISGADLGISLHCDASDNETAHGAHVCYCSEAGKSIARCVAARLCYLMPGRAESVVKRSDLYILKATKAPWVLAECGFATNAGDCYMLQHQPQDIARAMARGIEEYGLSLG